MSWNESSRASLGSTPGPGVWAHRGASLRAPENTVESVALAGRLGADGVEIDLRPARDQVVVAHDERTADGRLICEHPAAELDLPGITEMMAAAGDMWVNVELKAEPRVAPGWVDTAIDEAVAAGRADRLIVSSFDHRLLERVIERHPELRTGALLTSSGQLAASVDQLARAGHIAVHPPHRGVGEQEVELAHGSGLAVVVWTVNEPARARELARAGVDVVISDVPDEILSALGRSEPPAATHRDGG